MKMKEEFFIEDFMDVNKYVQNSYTVFTFLTHDFLDIIKRLKEELVERKI